MFQVEIVKDLYSIVLLYSIMMLYSSVGLDRACEDLTDDLLNLVCIQQEGGSTL